jgi:hypothetical protein
MRAFLHSPAEPSFGAFNPDQKVSKYFTLGQLTRTDTGLPNVPNDEEIANLTSLAQLLDIVYDEIGPFWIASAFRSSEVNAAVGGAQGSYHSRGIAADIVPMNGDPATMFQAVATSDLRNQMGEIIDKSEQGALHISLPTAEKVGVLMTREEGEYRRLSSSEISDLFASAAQAIEEAAPVAIPVAGVALVALAAFILYRRTRAVAAIA